MDLWAVHVKNTTGIPFPLRNSFPEKPIPWNLRKMVSFRGEDGRFFEISRVSRRRNNRVFVVKAMGKKNNDNSNSSSSSPGTFLCVLLLWKFLLFWIFGYWFVRTWGVDFFYLFLIFPKKSSFICMLDLGFDRF